MSVNLAINTVCIIILLMILLNMLWDKINKVNYDNQTKIISWMIIIDLLICVFDSISWYFNSNEKYTILAQIGTFFLYFFCIAYLQIFSLLCVQNIHVPSKLFKYTFNFIPFFSLLFQILLIFNLRYGFFYTYLVDTYLRGKYFIFSQTIPLVPIIFGLILICFLKEIPVREKITYVSYLFFPIISLTSHAFIEGITLNAISITFSMMAIYFNIYIERGRRLIQQDKELAQERINIMISQIQPHFIFNTLSAIMELCDSSPEEVKPAIADFADYLRNNIDSLKQNKLVLFPRELRHIQTYLKFEKLRFKDKLDVVYDIKAKRFLLPALTIQPLVENAVKHGVCKKEEGGIVKLSTDENDSEVIITVEDNGIGFDPEQLNFENNGSLKTHVGFSNVKKRLAVTCNGTLTVESEVGKGTKIIIRIPK